MSDAPMDLMDIAQGNSTSVVLARLAADDVHHNDERITAVAHPLIARWRVRADYLELHDAVERHKRHQWEGVDAWPLNVVEDEIRRLLYRLSTGLPPCPKCVVRQDNVGGIRPAGRCDAHPVRRLNAVA